MSERRRGDRRPVFLEIREINGQPGGESRVVDISDQGAKIETPMAFLPGEMVNIVFLRPDEETETRCQGVVVWRVSAADAPGRFLLGLEFLPCF